MPNSKHLASTISVGLGATGALAVLLLLGSPSTAAAEATAGSEGYVGRMTTEVPAARPESAAVDYVATGARTLVTAMTP